MTNDKKNWLVAAKSEVTGSYYSAGATKTILTSSTNPSQHSANDWINEEGNDSHPIVQLSGTEIYSGNGDPDSNLLVNNGGASVYIRYQSTINDYECMNPQATEVYDCQWNSRSKIEGMKCGGQCNDFKVDHIGSLVTLVDCLTLCDGRSDCYSFQFSS